MAARIDKVLAEKRKAIAGVFLSVLYGLAIQEMIAPVRAAFRSPEFAFGDVAIMVIFVLTVIRFFIGAQLYLWDDSVAEQKGATWLFNFTVLISQGILFVFLGGLSSRAASAASPLGFFGLLNWVLILDIVWIGLIFVTALLGADRQRIWISTPWQWATLNTSLVVLTLVLSSTVGADTAAMIGTMFAAHLAAFLIDVWLVDHCGLIAAERQDTKSTP